ncbi:13703_t:CDS:10 [Funneliformis geosporum]|uniref:16595_t:CDS:1 n=1 Tax=Funneliformis geosporum TaxID=1117311 RepID=A0A9W4WI79_9GLOM|nr:13703_t:CDS:10 [Funneliformis geosporum]CAI2163708.1 16595_t:CDS:10 [Funneliformis geosporum]
MLLSNFIGGKFASFKEETFIDSYNPSTGKVYAQIPNSSEYEINLAVEAAHKAFQTWSKTSRSTRAQIIYKIADILESKLDEFAKAESIDQGKTLEFAKNVDIPRSIYNFRYFAGHILHTEEKSTVMDNIALNYIQRSPLGVAGLISPWNLPLYLLTWKIAPCIAAGCTCVAKPSELTSVTAYMLCHVFKQAGLPEGVVNIVFGTGPKAGQALVSHPKVPLISFTGGTVTGKKVNETCASLLKKVSLELGGKNANIIFEDCDFEKTVDTSIRAAFSNQGEICLCGSRIFVQKSIYPKFLDAFISKTRQLVVGDPKDPKTKVGALISKQHMEKVLNYIELAKQEGGIIECGGRRIILDGELSDGYFVEPTVITNIKSSCRVAQEEIFGPVVTVHPFETEEEVINLTNDNQYGLSCSIWSENGRRVRRVAESIQVGYVWVNCWMVRDLKVPFGGVKKSGIGREGGEYSMNFFTEQKTICLAN